MAQTMPLKGLPFIKNFNTQEYNGGIQNWDITQSRNGILYVANNLGLLEYDGSEWTIHEVGNNSKLRSILIDDDGKIFVGNQADFGFFAPDASGALTYTSLADSLPPEFRNFDEAWKINKLNDAIYFCTFKNIYEYRNGRFRVIESNFNLEISFLVNNQLYVQQWQKGLSILQNGQFELIPSGEFFSEKRISDILLLDRDRLLITTFNHGIYTYSNGIVAPFQLDNDLSLPSAIINDALRLKSGKIAIGTQNEGLLIIDKYGNVEYHLDKDSGLLDRTINIMYQDDTGNLWLGMNFGLSRVELNSPFSIIDERLGIPGSGYSAHRSGNMVYLGTNNGLYVVNQGHFNSLHFKGNAHFIEGSEGQVYSIEKHANQLILGHHNGAFSVQNEKLTSLNAEKGAWTFKQIPSHPDYYIQGSYLGLNLYRMGTSGLRLEGKIQGFDESSRVLTFDDKDDLWVTQGYKGAYRLTFSGDLKRFTNVEYFNKESGFPSNILINVFNINNKLVFSSENGFYQFNPDNERFTPNVQYNRLIGEESTIIDIKEDEIGNVYFLEEFKIGRLIPNAFDEYEVETAPFNKIKGLLNDDLGNINILDYQNILFGASEGFIHFDPTYKLDIEQEFNVLLRKVQNIGTTDSVYFQGNHPENQRLVDSGSEETLITLPFRHNSLRFSYSAIHFESDDHLSYQYQLEGFDEGWSDWTAENTKEYTYLPEGEYTFKVRAKNVYEKESNEVHYRFQVSPPFYRTKIAYGFYSVGGVALLFMGFSFLDKRHKREQDTLKAKQEQELSRKDDKIQSITEQSEKEIMKLRNDKLRAEIEHKNNELTSSAMHLIQKNQLLNNIKNTLNTLTTKEAQKPVNQELKKIVKSISKDLANAEEWKVFEENFDKVHGNFITRIKEEYPDLTPQELKLSAYLRMNLNTKEIANLLNISVRGVEIGRYRVRKKLQLDRSDNLTDFILRF